MKIFKTTDEIAIKIDDVTVIVSPLNYEQKVEIQEFMLLAAKGDTEGIKAGMTGARLAVKYAVKRVENVTNVDGTEYKVKLKNGVLSDETVNELCNCEITDKLYIVSCQLLVSIPKQFIDPVTKLPMKGVSFSKNLKRAKKKK